MPATAHAQAGTAPPPLHRQLAGPVASLVAGPRGEQTLVVNVAPDGVGPVTVKAHLGGDGLRVELLAPTDAGRDALRAMLPDLRRDLASTGAGYLFLAAGDVSGGGASAGGTGSGPNHPAGQHADYGGARPDGTHHGARQQPSTGDATRAGGSSGTAPDGAAQAPDAVGGRPHQTTQHLDVMA
ncbi:flagellar hook-length control protein FliK [Arthrobacter halodurans]|uniref:Flagellar hook-length control protein FliK n=1 Tax=Arthrobacter halodurans TaxID=516699 RepID=A0ABV4UNX8_9MICC